ncbi:Hypothetical_protein [Hexamita inflata]|uniref:Hypothetical_protein n=1 Tax=Hexamita inflata TaxID=28002 RepID=A0AA86P7A1_9EUKA|nr:Hypothetical protein HINF_LOCUS19721 [Hexamita inflata]CAI9970286.1 Hypothetical protein HINF_LOCUS57931 [Hexamita inflata]
MNVKQSALICRQCEILIKSSTMIFEAKGEKIAGLVLFGQNKLELNNCSVQLRVKSQYAAGMVNMISNTMLIQLNNVKQTMFDFIHSQYNGYIASEANISIQMEFNYFQVCAQLNRFGAQSTIQTTTTEQQNICSNICESGLKFIYGFCLHGLYNGKHILGNDTYICEFPFDFNGEQCQCSYGYILNISSCVDIVHFIKLLSTQIGNNFSLISNIVQNNPSPDSKFADLDNSIINNASQLQLDIDLKYLTSEQHLTLNSSKIEIKINNLITKTNILLNNSNTSIIPQLILNISDLDNRRTQNATNINNSITALNTSLNADISNIFNNIIAVNNSIIAIALNYQLIFHKLMIQFYQLTILYQQIFNQQIILKVTIIKIQIVI